MSEATFASKPTQVRWLIVLLLTGFTFLAHWNRVSISVAANAFFIGPEKISEQEMGFVYSAFLLIYTLGMLPGGWVLDRIGPRWAMTGLGLGFGLLTVLTGVLGWAGLSIPAMLFPLLIIRGIAGATSVPLHPGAARSVSLWLPINERFTANGLITAGALVGIACCYPGFGWLMKELGWQAAFAICGMLLFLLGLVWCLVSTDDPKTHPWSNAVEKVLVLGTAPPPSRTKGTFADFLKLLQNRGLVLLTISYGAIGYVQYMFFYWIEYYFEKELKLPSSESRSAAFTITMSMAVGMACGGWASDRLCTLLGQAVGCRIMALGGMSLGAVFSLLGISTNDPQHIVWYFSLALGSIGLCEGIFWTTAPILEKRNAGLACALLNTGGNGIGILSPSITPILGQRFGWTFAIAVACGISLIGGLLWLGIRIGDSQTNRDLSKPFRPDSPSSL